ncbi:MAG: S-methyl-5-thioribose-1-phosphate isomerase [Bacteroidetes bacterium]|nr:S-methyl-5-thioribose-1-phosphate isomerase [Bacteroidota bacterium]
MRIGDTHYRTIWLDDDPTVVRVIDQRKLPFELEFMDLRLLDDACFAISEMVVRGAPLIGVTAAFGLYLAGLNSDASNWCDEVKGAGEQLIATRPTAVNLKYAVDLGLGELNCAGSREGMIERLFHLAMNLAEKEVERSRQIGEHGLALIRDCYEKRNTMVNILTHCNAGWLACVDYGTATAPIYRAHDEGIPLHVWVDETRPRNQGARLTAYELGEHGVPHTVVVDNAGGHLMQNGQVDMVIVGSDRTTRTGDVANKIGTYLKALAARDNNIPFYVALPTSTIDRVLASGSEIEIENRDSGEVCHMDGWNDEEDKSSRLRVLPASSKVANPGFDVTPARLVSGLITEKGVCPASEEAIQKLFKG